MIGQISIDLYNDWINYLKQQLGQWGYNVEETDKPLDIAIKYFNVQKRIISNKCREIFISKEFSCSAEFLNSIEVIKEAVVTGKDLNSYLSINLLDARYNDQLLNDWGIHHLHLGNTPDKKRPQFVERTIALLFAYVTEDKFFLIAVGKHGDWCERRLVEILHNNWPEQIEKFRIIGINAAPPLSEAQLKNIRNKHVNASIEFPDGSVYAPFGGGVMSSGISTNIIFNHDKQHWVFRDLEKNISKIVEEVRQKGIELEGDLIFRLHMEKEKICLFEENSKTLISFE